jgi:hypothetical protein
MPPEHDDVAAEALDPALAYSVLLMCESSQRWEDAAELIVDLNRNRDLTDDPVMLLCEAWSHREERPRIELHWFTRVFDPVTLRRTAPGQAGGETLPAIVRAVPSLRVTYRKGESDPDRLSLGFSPTSYRKGQLTDGGITRDVVISPDDTRFGRFDGPTHGCWNITDGDWINRYPLTTWNYDRGAFWGCTLDAGGRELRDGPYEGPTGILRAESGGGEALRISRIALWLRGEDPHRVTSSGWPLVPRFPALSFAHRELPLPVGDYAIERIELTRGWSSWVVVEPDYSKKRYTREFSVANGRSTVYRLPKMLEMTAYASIEERPHPSAVEYAWSSESDPSEDETSQWKGPTPGSTVKIGVSMSDPASDNRYAIYHRGDPPPDSLHLVITGPSGNMVHQDTMEYG